MTDLPLLNTERLFIKFPEKHEAELIAAYYQRNRKYLQPFEPKRLPHFFTEEYWESQIQEIESDFLKQRKISFIVFNKTSPDSIIGVINFNHWVQGAFQSCILGFSLDEQFQGQGFMREALHGTIAFIFAQYHLHRIEANYLPGNHRSEKLLQRLGFEKFGQAPHYLLINGHWADHVLTQKLNPKC